VSDPDRPRGASGAGVEPDAAPDPWAEPEPAGEDPGEAQQVDLGRALLAQARVGSAPGQRLGELSRRVPARPNRTGPPSTGARAGAWTGAGPGLARSGLSGPGPDDRDPTGLGPAVDRLVRERGWEVPVAVGGIEGRWDQVVGADLAAHCVPEGFAEGVVTVRADSTAWATQVRLLAPTLVRRLNEDLGPRTVTAVRVLGPAGPSWRKGMLRVPGRGPRDTYG
jgi:predicted nucleic acid-binding Zn ribbon protein